MNKWIQTIDSIWYFEGVEFMSTIATMINILALEEISNIVVLHSQILVS